MFTGIVEELGEVVGKEELGDSARLVIRGPVVTADAGHGDSIAVNGVCLTVVEVLPDGAFSADVMGETLHRSSLRSIGVGSQVNLERAAAVNSRLGGHIVQGHVDGTGHVIARTPSEHWEGGSRCRRRCPGMSSRRVRYRRRCPLRSFGPSQISSEVPVDPDDTDLTTLGKAEVDTRQPLRGRHHRQIR